MKRSFSLLNVTEVILNKILTLTRAVLQNRDRGADTSKMKMASALLQARREQI